MVYSADQLDVGTLLDGSKFDSSRDRGSPFVTQIGVGRVIKGWDEGVTQLSVGQKANLICTPDYGKLVPKLPLQPVQVGAIQLTCQPTAHVVSPPSSPPTRP
jgi:FKBP-type peptidyl-prolyl cis-trans isomerase 2